MSHGHGPPRATTGHQLDLLLWGSRAGQAFACIPAAPPWWAGEGEGVSRCARSLQSGVAMPSWAWVHLVMGTPWGHAGMVTPWGKGGLEPFWDCPWRDVGGVLVENEEEGV